MNKPRVLLFDLGGVIVRWTGVEELAGLTGLTRDQIIDVFAGSSIFQDYETGRCDDDIFADEMIRLFGLAMNPETFKQLWRDWVGQPYPGLDHILPVLKDHYMMACLSNTNDLHWRHLEHYFDFSAHFDHSFASHQIHYAKPGIMAYRHVCESLNVSPENIHFFDDTEINVQSAEEFGMRATLIDPSEGVGTALLEHGYIDRDFYYLRESEF